MTDIELTSVPRYNEERGTFELVDAHDNVIVEFGFPLARAIATLVVKVVKAAQVAVEAEAKAAGKPN